MIAAAMILLAAQAVPPQPQAPLQGRYDCTIVGNAVSGALRTQSGARSIDEFAPANFQYGAFRFTFAGETVTVSLEDNGRRLEQTVPFFRRGAYAAFSFHQRLDVPGAGSSPIAFWTNEAGAETARFEASFAVVHMRQMTTMTGYTFNLGDAAMAVAALSCRKGAS